MLIETCDNSSSSLCKSIFQFEGGWFCECLCAFGEVGFGFLFVFMKEGRDVMSPMAWSFQDALVANFADSVACNGSFFCKQARCL